VATALDVEPSRVQVLQGDTAEVPQGNGTFASRSLQIGGPALFLAARHVLEEARRRASEMLEVAPEDISHAKGTFSVAGSPDRAVTLREVAAEAPLLRTEVFESPQAFPFGSYVAVVEIDTDTGEIEVRKLVAVDDCGVVVSPLIVEGQAVGSIVQGLGQALYEGVIHDEQGQPLTASLITYGVPSSTELTEIVLASTLTPNPNGPLGAKGAGEAGCIGTPPAVVNAIIDALHGYDVSGLDMPVTPEKVWRALRTPI
jgi:carbon-monoxide dehydrogenase large subunit